MDMTFSEIMAEVAMKDETGLVSLYCSIVPCPICGEQPSVEIQKITHKASIMCPKKKWPLHHYVGKHYKRGTSKRDMLKDIASEWNGQVRQKKS